MATDSGPRIQDPTTAETRRLVVLVAIAVLTGLAFAMRLWRLEFQSLWWDEGVSIYLAGAGLPALTYAKDFAVDLHPPGYHLLLALWRALFGPSVFSMRLLSVEAGVLTVPVVAKLGMYLTRQDARVRVGILAALLATVSPIAVFYSQESRMYPFLPLLGALSLYQTIRIIRRGTADRWLLWVGANAISWYVYYYFAFWSLALSLALLFWAVKKPGARSPRLRSWLLAQVTLVVAFLPWLLLLARTLGNSATIPIDTAVHLTPASFLGEIAQDFTVGFTAPPEASLFLAGWAILVLVGTLTVGRGDPGLLGLLLVAGLLPVAGAGGILLTRPFFYPRFILFAIVPLWLLVALALGEARRSWWPALLILPLVAGSLWTYRAERFASRVAYSSSDYRTAFSTLAPNARSGDPVLVDYPWQAGYVDAYLGPLGVRSVFSRGMTTSQLRALVERGQRVWVYSYDPSGHFTETDVEKAVTGALPVRFVDRYGDSQVALFAATPSPSTTPGSGPRATFADGISLKSATLSTNILPPGATLAITLDWRASAAPTAGYHVFVHLLWPNGKVAAQQDSAPLEGRFPTSSWPAGSEFLDRYSLALPANAATGAYQVEVGLYRPDNGVRLTALSGSDHDNRVLLGSVKVGP